MDPELQHYLEMIDDLRGQVGRLIADLPAEALNWRPIEGTDGHTTNSLAALATHVAGSERFWIGEVIGGLPAGRDRDAEFAVWVGDPAELLQRLDEVGATTRQVFS